MQPTPVVLPGKSHGQRSLAGYSPWDLERLRHDLATKQQSETYLSCLEQGGSEGELTVYTTWIKEFLTVPKEQPTRLSRRMNTLSPLPGTRGLPPASSVSLLSFSLCVAFTASPRHQLSVYMLLALGNTQLSQKPNSKFPGLSQVSNELFLVQITTAKRHSSSTPQT